MPGCTSVTSNRDQKADSLSSLCIELQDGWGSTVVPGTVNICPTRTLKTHHNHRKYLQTEPWRAKANETGLAHPPSSW